MSPQEQLEQAANNREDLHCHDEWMYIEGGLKGMEIQKEIDRQEIDRLKEVIKIMDRKLCGERVPLNDIQKAISIINSIEL